MPPLPWRWAGDGLKAGGSLKDLSLLPQDVDEQPTGMLHHKPGEHTRLRRRSFLHEARTEHTRRHSQQVRRDRAQTLGIVHALDCTRL